MRGSLDVNGRVQIFSPSTLGRDKIIKRKSRLKNSKQTKLEHQSKFARKAFWGSKKCNPKTYSLFLGKEEKLTSISELLHYLVRFKDVHDHLK